MSFLHIFYLHKIGTGRKGFLKMTKKVEGLLIREGRNRKQYINTEFDFIDALNNYADCETLGFYISFKRFINRKDNTKDNQITYTQKYLETKFNIGRTKYYRHLKTLFNAGLCDVEKTVEVKFFLNYNLEDKKNPLVEKTLLYFSTLDDINISLKDNLEELIESNYPEIPKDLIKIVDVVNRTSFVFHDYPPIDIFEDNNYEIVAYRDWDILMNRFSSGKNSKKNVEKETSNPPSQNKKDPSSQNRKEGGSQNEQHPSSQNEKEGDSQNRKDPPSQNRNLNIIKELSNTRIELPNIITEPPNNIIESSNTRNEVPNNINQSISPSIDIGNNENMEIEIEGHTDISNNQMDSYNKTIRDCELGSIDESYRNAVSHAIKLLFLDIENKNRIRIGENVIPSEMVRNDLNRLNYLVIEHAVNKFKEASGETEIRNKVAYLKTCIYNSIHEVGIDVDSELRYRGLIS